MNLSFNDGLKEYIINNDPDRVIRINPADVGILKRLQAAQTDIDALRDKYSNADNTADALAECDRALRDIIDNVFGAKIADTVFGSTNCLSIAGGASVYENFLNAIVPEIESTVKAESEASAKRVKQYTDKVM